MWTSNLPGNWSIHMNDQPEQNENADSTSAVPKVTGFRKLAFLLAAGFFLLLGVLGVVVPGLPTTPFLLLTSYFLARTSPELNRKLLDSRLIGPILTDWQVKRGVRRDIKAKAISVVVLAVSATIFFSGAGLWLSVLVIGIAAIGIGVIIKLPTLSRKQTADHPN